MFELAWSKSFDTFVSVAINLDGTQLAFADRISKTIVVLDVEEGEEDLQLQAGDEQAYCFFRDNDLVLLQDNKIQSIDMKTLERSVLNGRAVQFSNNAIAMMADASGDRIVEFVDWSGAKINDIQNLDLSDRLFISMTSETIMCCNRERTQYQVIDLKTHETILTLDANRVYRFEHGYVLVRESSSETFGNEVHLSFFEN